jgi:hypothetical protein
MVHTVTFDGYRVASSAGEPTMDEVDTSTTAPSPTPPPSPNVTGNAPGTVPQPTDTDLDAAAASNPSTPGEKFTSTF